MQMKQNVLFLCKALLNLITEKEFGVKWVPEKLAYTGLIFKWLGCYLNFSVQFMKSIEYLIRKRYNYEVNHILWKIRKIMKNVF